MKFVIHGLDFRGPRFQRYELSNLQSKHIPQQTIFSMVSGYIISCNLCRRFKCRCVARKRQYSRKFPSSTHRAKTKKLKRPNVETKGVTMTSIVSSENRQGNARKHASCLQTLACKCMLPHISNIRDCQYND